MNLDMAAMIKSDAMRVLQTAAFVIFATLLLAAGELDRTTSRGKVVNGVELLYVTGKTGIGIYDINDNHKLLRKFEVPETGGWPFRCGL